MAKDLRDLEYEPPAPNFSQPEGRAAIVRNRSDSRKGDKKPTEPWESLYFANGTWQYQIPSSKGKFIYS